MCYLKCYGFEKSNTIEGNETVKRNLADGTVVVMFVSCMAFSCCDEIVASNDVRATLKMPKTRSTSKANANANPNEIVSEMKIMKQMLESIQMATETNTRDISEMKKCSSKTEANIQKLTDRNEGKEFAFTATPQSPGLSYVTDFRKRMTAKANATPVGSSNRLKRRRTDSTSRTKQQFPEPKMGTKTNANGLSVVPKPDRNRESGPKFEKALWVSRLSTQTTNDDVIAYITSNTSVTDSSRINVHKLVKKDVDVTTLQFVSFKVEMNAEDLDVLNDSNLWPQYVQVREFLQTPKNVLGNYFPALSKQKGAESATPSAETDLMDL